MLRGKLRKGQSEKLLRPSSQVDLASDSTETMDTYASRHAYERQSITIQIHDAISELMEQKKLTQHDLAKAIGLTEGRISQILGGDQNLTIKTLAALAVGLEAHFKIELVANSQLVQDSETVQVGDEQSRSRERIIPA